MLFTVIGSIFNSSTGSMAGSQLRVAAVLFTPHLVLVRRGCNIVIRTLLVRSAWQVLYLFRTNFVCAGYRYHFRWRTPSSTSSISIHVSSRVLRPSSPWTTLTLPSFFSSSRGTSFSISCSHLMCFPLHPGTSQIGLVLLILEKQTSSASLSRRNRHNFLSLMILLLCSGALYPKALHSHGGVSQCTLPCLQTCSSSRPGRGSHLAASR